MKIQISTDKTFNGEKMYQESFITQITKYLEKYNSHITDIKVHLSDQNDSKKGLDDILCLFEVKLDDRLPLVVSIQANSIESATLGAIDKLKNTFETVLGRMQNHHQKIDK